MTSIFGATPRVAGPLTAMPDLDGSNGSPSVWVAAIGWSFGPKIANVSSPSWARLALRTMVTLLVGLSPARRGIFASVETEDS